MGLVLRNQRTICAKLYVTGQVLAFLLLIAVKRTIPKLAAIEHGTVLRLALPAWEMEIAIVNYFPSRLPDW